MNYLSLILFVLPAYFANITPLFLGGGKPLDLGKKFTDGKRIFGGHKTINGFVFGIVIGVVVSFAIAFSGLLNFSFFHTVLIGFMASSGAMCGDCCGSFLKRRMGIKEGETLLFSDQLSFIIFAIIFASPFYAFSIDGIVFILLLTFVLHYFSNKIAFLLKIKKVPW